MSTPGGIELNKSVPTTVGHQLLEVLAYSHLNRSIVVLRQSLRLDEGLQFTVNQIFSESE